MRTLRFNKEDFGYLVGYETGEIILAKPEARDMLERSMPAESLREQGLLLERMPIRSGFHLRTPPLVWIELTRACNLRCPHCYITGGEARTGELPTSWFHSVLEDLAAMGVWAVAFTGGEPTMHPGFVELVNRARELDLLVGVATNGMFLTDRLLDSMRTDGVILSVSLDNLHIQSDPTAENRVVQRAIRRAHAKGFRTNIMTNSNRENAGELEDVVRWAKDNRVSVRSVPFSPLGRGKEFKDRLELGAADALAAADFWVEECMWEHEYHSEVGLCVGAIFNYGLSFAYMTNRCSSGRYLAYICADGTVYPCTMCAGEQILSPGSIANRPFSQLWADRWEIRDFSWERFSATCEGCPVNSQDYYCAARCPATSHARHGSYFQCGASDFEVVSMVVRTPRLTATKVGKLAGIPVVNAASQRK